ncbi:stress-responsive transcription factor hsf1 [Lobosporangium transversale]|nr:stress-responsive transcription factor hsf1 [Lobosporangium transversale]
MMYSTNGFIDPTNTTDSSPTASNLRIVELSSGSPLTATLDSSTSANNIIDGQQQPIVTTPDSSALSYLSPSGNSSINNSGNLSATISRPSMALINNSQQQQQKASDAALALLSNLGSSNTISPTSIQANAGRSTVINHVEFAKEVLPKFFKHNNFSSFVRQLNMYGFHKVPHLQQGVLMPDSDSEQWEFSNPHFQRNQPDLLYLVSRKKASNANEDKDALTMDLGHILQEVTAIKRHQVAISTDLKNIERDHQALWQESVAARERHQRQQETIDKILRFLASVFSGEKKRAIVPNKKVRLTITDGDHLDGMVGSTTVDDGRKLVEQEDEEEVEEEEETASTTVAGSKRKRSEADNGAGTVEAVLNHSKPSLNISEITPATLAMLANANGNINQKHTSDVGLSVPSSTSAAATATTNLPTVPVSAPANINNLSFPDYLTSLPALNYANLNNNSNGILNNLTLPAGFKFDPSNLTIPSSLLPNGLSPVHHDMLRQISMANAQDMNQASATPLAPLPPSFSQTPAGANVTKSVDQITHEVEQLQRSIEALSQHGLNVDTFDFDDDAYLSLADSFDPNGLTSLDQGVIGNPDTLNTTAAPSTAGVNPRISTVGGEEEYLEDLLDLEPV